VRLGIVVPGGFDPDPDVATIPALRRLVQELAGRHRVEVFASAGRQPLRYRLGDVGVTQMGPRASPAERPRLASARLAVAFARWMRAAGPFDLLHAFWADRTALIAALAARAVRIPSVVSLGGGELVWLPDIPYGGAGTTRSRAVTRAALTLSDAITAGTSFVARPLPGRLAGRVQLVPLGVDFAQFAAPPARPPGPPWRLVHVANLNEVKDQATLLRAFRRVVDRLGDVWLDCVGQDALQGTIQARALALGLGGRVSFRGFVPQGQLAELFRAAHLHVLSSRHESQGVVILEAAAAGLPTAGTRVGLVDTLAPSAACAVPVGDAEALGDAICGLLVDADARQAMGAAAQRFAQTHDVAWTARAFEAIYAKRSTPG
jgi:glycosyltransferase involved in cell wall biosynthesis